MAFYRNVASQLIPVFAYDTSAKAPKAGDAANITAYIRKDGGTGIATNDVNPTEADATNMKGLYEFTMTQAESNCEVLVLAPVSATSNIQLDPVVIYPDPIAAMTMLRGTVDNTNHTPTTTEFECDDITEATADHFKGRIVIFTSGALLQQAARITAYALATGRGHFTVEAMTEAPANDVTLVIV